MHLSAIQSFNDFKKAYLDEINNEVKILEIGSQSINESIKKLKKNYYDLRSKKVRNLINNINRGDFKKSTLGGCIFFKKGENLCLKSE